MTTDKKPTELATIADLQGLAKEFGDIREAASKFGDGDPTNNAPAALEIIQSLSVIGATLTGMAAFVVYIAQQMGLLGS